MVDGKSMCAAWTGHSPTSCTSGSTVYMDMVTVTAAPAATLPVSGFIITPGGSSLKKYTCSPPRSRVGSARCYWNRCGAQCSHPARNDSLQVRVGRHCCYWNGYGAQCGHPAQKGPLTASDRPVFLILSIFSLVVATDMTPKSMALGMKVHLASSASARHVSV